MNWIEKKKDRLKSIDEDLKKKNREEEIDKRRSQILNPPQPQPSTSSTPPINTFTIPASLSSSDNMEPELTPAQARQLFNDLRQEIANLRNNQLQAQTAPVVPYRPRTRQEKIMESFISNPLQVHNQLNPRKPVLVYEGTNFPIWETALDQTIRHVLVRELPFTDKPENFDSLTVDEASTVVCLMRNTVVDSLGDILDAAKLTAPKAVFELLKTKCSRSDRQRKIELLNKLLALINNPAPATDATTSVWAKLKSELSQLKVTWDKAIGIFLQSHYKPPVGVDAMTFEFTISQQLNEKEAPPFDDVLTIVQFAANKLRNKSGAPPTLPGVPQIDPMAMDLDRIQAMQSQPRYVAPQRRTGQQPVRNQPQFSVDKANHFKGKGQSDSLVEKHGDHCFYCGDLGHWYPDCAHFWKDVATGKISPPDSDYKSKNSKYRPPSRPEGSGNRIQQVNILEVSDEVLLDSGASAHCDDPNSEGSPGH